VALKNHSGILFKVSIIVALFHIPLFSQDVVQYFKTNCASCHTIGGGRLTGPDLKNVTQRQSREWLVKWILDPEGILNSGDPYALKLQKESRGAIMRRTPGINQDLANALLNLIDEESKKEKSQFAGTRLSDRPLLPGDIEEGRKLFTGQKALINGGPSCIGCHHVNSFNGILGGGRLGPNLTRAYARLQGRKGLSAWLIAPPGLTMSPVFKEHPLDEKEILPLVAFLKNETEKDAPQSSALMINFILFGLGGVVVLLVLFDLIWSRRFKGVRQALLKESKQIFYSKR